MPTLNPNNYAYLWSPTRQILNMDGKPLIGGYIMIDRYGTVGVHAESYCDWNGTLNARQILLDSLGRATAIVESDKLYNMYVYNKYNVLQYSALGVNCCSDGDSGTSPMSFTSRDGSLTITRSGNNVDFSVNKDPSSYGSAVSDSVDESGALVFNGVTGDLTIVSANTLSLNNGKMYHITVQAKIDIAEPMDSYHDCIMRDSENTAHPFIIDGSRASQYVDLSWDMVATHNYFRLYFEIPEGSTLDEVALYIHSVTSVNIGAGGGASYTAGDGINISPENVISADYTKVQEKLVAGENITIDPLTNTISATGGSFSQVQADWDEADTSDPSYIKNKPTLFSGDYNDLTNKPNLATVATTGDYDDLINKPDLSIYALSSAVPTINRITI